MADMVRVRLVVVEGELLLVALQLVGEGSLEEHVALIRPGCEQEGQRGHHGLGEHPGGLLGPGVGDKLVGPHEGVKVAVEELSS
ncbi:MAG: hypothetical protein R3F60_22265 [bacterium]